MQKGIFVVIDGGEGAGKTTQLARAKEFFGDEIVITREPGGSPYAEEIRNLILKSPHAAEADAKTIAALFWAARADHLRHTILPALRAGKIVISDRFDSSTYAYQIVAEGAREIEEFFWQSRRFFLEDRAPDLYVYFDVDPAVGLARKRGQGADEQNRFERRPIAFHEKLRDGFREFLAHVPHEVVNANLPEEAVWERFKKIMLDQLEASR